MKKYFLATISALALLGGSASAADLIPEVKAAPVFYNWSGFYVGADVGTAWASNNWDDRLMVRCRQSFRTNGVLPAFMADGITRQVRSYLALKETFDYTNVRGSAAVVNEIGRIPGGSANLATETNWIATVVGRAGVTTGSVLYYLVGGWR